MELKDLIVTYARQETVDPLKTLGRYLGFGITGALLIGLGWVFALLALLRGLQRISFFNNVDNLNYVIEADGGTWSWLPYLIVTLVGMVVAAVYGRMLVNRLEQTGEPK